MKRRYHVCVDGGIIIWEYHVCVKDAEEMKEAIAFLEEKGFENVQNLTEENYHFPVLVVKYNYFFGTNVTCMACSASKGNTIRFEEFKAILGQKRVFIKGD